ncbi:hypothetical protein [Croceibacter atlanticus]|uniref:hypothetical protein n=1 Tax=Croceibacter atlanticus TaxID=313588 RepID=UPI002491874A|nr:hypothetical protein [Croceibacter atlanticus]
MEIQNEILKLFGNLSNVKIDERVTTFRLDAILQDAPNIGEISIKSFNQNIPNRDNYKFSLIIDEQEPIGLSNISNIDNFITEVNEYFKFYETGEQISLRLEIDKKVTADTLSIYSFQEFDEFTGTKTALDFLTMLNSLESNTGCINFEFLEKSLTPFQTSRFHFGYNFDKCQFNNRFHLIQANCYFTNGSEFSYSGDHFKIIRKPAKENNIIKHLDTLTSLFSIVSIFDYSTIIGDKLEYKLKGYKLYQGNIKVDNNFYPENKEYYNLYEWIYSSDGNVADKLGVARNIISLHIAQGDIKIDETLIHSIKSAHQTYLKENVSNYLALRSKILDELSWISQKSSEVIQTYLQAYKQSSLTFVSFFISIFLLRTLRSGEFSKVFTSEVTLIALSFLGLSVIYLFFSRYNVLKERDRLKRKYSNLKNRYKDLLIQQDIDKILNNDSEFKYEKEFINSRITNYTWLWALTIVVLLITILSVSELIGFSFYYG